MSNDNITSNDLNKQKIEEAFLKKIKLHLVLKNSIWRNGFIQELKDNFFIINDMHLGPLPIFYIEIGKVEPYITPKEQNREDIENGS